MTISEAIRTGTALLQIGRLSEAENVFRGILAVEPNHAASWHLLGLVAHRTGRTALAIDCMRRAVAFEPSLAAAHLNLGNVLSDAGSIDEAVACFERALELAPNAAEAHYNLANAKKLRGKIEEALGHYQRAIELKPGFVEAYHNLGTCWKELQKFDEAVACFRRALEIKPSNVETYSNLGNVLIDEGCLDEAIAVYRKVTEVQPSKHSAFNSLGVALQAAGRLDEAAESVQRALALKPDYAEAHGSWAHLCLLHGDFENGWREYEWRWKTEQFPPRILSQPAWQGEALAGKRILLWSEQGLGDAIQFIRYAPLVQTLGATVVVECQREIVPLLATCRGIDRVMGRNEELPPFDFHAPLLSLPGILGTRADTIPADAPYLFANAGLVELWREKLAGIRKRIEQVAAYGPHGVRGLLIGINWRGLEKPGLYRLRDIPIVCFEQLADVPGVRLVSLQKQEFKVQGSRFKVEEGAVAGSDPSLTHRVGVVDFGEELDAEHGAFMDTAAIMMNLDLVITSDTSVAHLAGALGVSVWVALPFAPDWRWMLERSDSPWYPTMRLFRQKTRGDWAGVFKEIEAALRKRISG